MQTTKYQEKVILKGGNFTIWGRRYAVVHNRLMPYYTLFGRVVRAFFGQIFEYPLLQINNNVPNSNWQYYKISRRCYVLYDCKWHYPYFDSNNNIVENHYFRLYYLCRSLAEVQQKYNFIKSDEFGADGDPRSALVPFVYWDDSKNIFLVCE